MNARGPLRLLLDKHKQQGIPMGQLTVMAVQNDPYRLDTERHHRNGEWLAEKLVEVGVTGRLHIRGMHYRLIGTAKPDGTPYTNTDADWNWLQSQAVKAARWLGYIGFDQVADERNDAPTIRRYTKANPTPKLGVEPFHLYAPDDDELIPTARLDGFVGQQPYRLVVVGEKSSVEAEIGDVCERYRADLYLPTGEMSDTMVWQMAQSAVDDGRPLRVFYLADCDPAGWQMPVSVAHKLQALADLGKGPTDVEVHRVALTPDHVAAHGLPSTPLKAGERRADKWTQATGVEQTELDAALALSPGLLADLLDEALDPFFDKGLSRRVSQVRNDWLEAADQAVRDNLDPDAVANVRETVRLAITEMQAQIDELLDGIRVDPGDVNLPALPALPAAELGDTPEPLLSTRWPFVERVRRLRAEKDYQ